MYPEVKSCSIFIICNNKIIIKKYAVYNLKTCFSNLNDFNTDFKLSVTNIVPLYFVLNVINCSKVMMVCNLQ